MVCSLANEMSKTEDVSVCVFWQTDEDTRERRLSRNVKFYDMGFDGNGKPVKEIFKFHKSVRNGDYDIVHIHGFFYLYMLTIFLLHNKTTFFYTLHSDAYHEGTEWDNKLISVKRLFFRKGWMHPICISTHAQQTFAELYGCDSALIHNGITNLDVDKAMGRKMIDSFKINQSTKVFLHPGRITKAKNQIVLCEAFDKLINNGYDVVLLIAGGKQDAEVFNLISEHFSDRIIYIGERQDIPSLLSAADGMCLPSLFEGFGLVVVEALAMACIPVCSPVGGVTDIIEDGRNGILSKSTTADDYYEAMVSLLSLSDNALSSMKEQALLSSSRFDITATVKQYFKQYNLYI